MNSMPMARLTFDIYLVSRLGRALDGGRQMLTPTFAIG